MSLFRRRRKSLLIEDLPVVRSPALEEMRRRVAELTQETDERVTRLLQRLEARLAEERR